MSKDAKLVLPADGSIQKAIAGARSAEKGPNYYVVFRYAGGAGTTLEVAGEGAGGWDEASALLTKDDGAYVFLRQDLKVEMAKTVKFAYVEWFPDGLKAMRRIALSALKKPVADILKPFHVELSASELKDVTQKIVDDRIAAVSGVAVHTREKGASVAAAAAPAAEAPAAAAGDAPAAEAPAPKKPEAKAAPKPAAPKQSFVGAGGAGGIKFADGTAVPDAIKELRDDKKETNWLLVTYSDRDTLTLAGSGTDGFTGLHAAFNDADIQFGLLRVTDLVDGKSKTTKFVYIKSVPDSVKPMKRAEIPTRAGAIEKVFGQSHVQFDISKKAEITEQQVVDKVGNASGSKSNVKDK